MKLQDRINRTVQMIRTFETACRIDDYTDTGEAWEVLHDIEALWSPLYGKKRLEPAWLALLAVVAILAALIWL